MEVYNPDEKRAEEAAAAAEATDAVQATFLPTVEPVMVFAANGRGPATGPVVTEGSVRVPTM